MVWCLLFTMHASVLVTMVILLGGFAIAALNYAPMMAIRVLLAMSMNRAGEFRLAT
jgi:hypothetical protein